MEGAWRREGEEDRRKGEVEEKRRRGGGGAELWMGGEHSCSQSTPRNTSADWGVITRRFEQHTAWLQFAAPNPPRRQANRQTEDMALLGEGRISVIGTAG